MKNKIKIMMIASIAFLAICFNGCILDAFDTLTQEFPLETKFVINEDTGIVATVNKSATVNLNDSKFYQNNKNKIETIKLVKIAYRTLAVTPANLTGTISVKISSSNGTTLLNATFPGAPALFITSPLELSLTQQQMTAINKELEKEANRTLTAAVTVDNISPLGVGYPKHLEASVDIVFEMEYKL